MPNRSFTENLVDWEALVTNLEPLVAELPNIAADHAALTALATAGRGLESEQDMHKRMLRETNQKRNLLQVDGKRLRDKLLATVRGHFGLDSVRLLDYGIEPLKPRRRGRLSPTELKAKKAAEAPAVAAALASPTLQRQ